MENEVINFSRFYSFCIQKLNYRSHLYLGAWMQGCLHLENWLFPNNNIWCHVLIPVATQSKTWTVFACSNTGIMGSNLTQGMDVCVRLFRVHVVLHVGCSCAMSWSPVQEVLPTVHRTEKLKKWPRSTRAVEAQREKKNGAMWVLNVANRLSLIIWHKVIYFCTIQILCYVCNFHLNDFCTRFEHKY
jgi:hypothetical protein